MTAKLVLTLVMRGNTGLNAVLMLLIRFVCLVGPDSWCECLSDTKELVLPPCEVVLRVQTHTGRLI